MKKFQFSLDRLLEFKEKSQKHEKGILAAFRKQLDVLVEESHELQRQLREANERFNARAAQGMSPQAMQADKAYIKSLQEQIKEKQAQIFTAQSKVEKQLALVVELSKEVSSIESLKDKQLEEYRKLEMKQDELFVEEFVSNSSFYAK